MPHFVAFQLFSDIKKTFSFLFCSEIRFFSFSEQCRNLIFYVQRVLVLKIIFLVWNSVYSCLIVLRKKGILSNLCRDDDLLFPDVLMSWWPDTYLYPFKSQVMRLFIFPHNLTAWRPEGLMISQPTARLPDGRTARCWDCLIAWWPDGRTGGWPDALMIPWLSGLAAGRPDSRTSWWLDYLMAW